MRRAWRLCRLPVAAAAWVLCLTWVLAMAEADLPPCDLSHLSGLLDAANVAWRAPQPASSSGDTPGSSGSSGSGSGGSDALPRLHLGQCRLRRFTQDEARECLADRPLVMVGDSLMRYQFLSLIHWLELGVWPSPTTGTPEHPSPVIEAEWAINEQDGESWPRFFRGTTELFNGTQQCHCYRNWDGDHIDIREDRFYRSGRLSASFYWWMGHPYQPLQGRWAFPPFGNGTACEPGRCGPQADYALPLYEAIRKVIAQLKPSVFVFNSGLWRAMLGGEPWSPEVHEALLSAADAAVAPQGGMCIWKTTTWLTNNAVQQDWDAATLRHAADHGWSVMDAWALTNAAGRLQPPPFWDGMHSLGYVYEDVNQFLLNMICPAGGAGRAGAAGKHSGPGARPFLPDRPSCTVSNKQFGAALFVLGALVLAYVGSTMHGKWGSSLTF